MRISKYAIGEIILFHVFLLFFALSFPDKDDWRVTAVLLLLVACLMILELRRTGVIVSPLFFWYAFWLGVISIGRMDLGIRVYPLYQTWGVRLHRLVLGNTALFFWICLPGELAAEKIRGVRRSLGEGCAYKEKLADLVIGMFLAALLAYAVNVAATGVIPQLTGDANSCREEFIQTRYYRIVSMLRVSFALCPTAIRAARSREKKLAVAFLGLLLLAAEMLSGWRSFTMQAVIMLITGLSFTMDLSGGKNRKTFFTVILFSGIFALAFIAYIAVTRDAVRGALKEKAEYLLYTLYMYMAPNFLNFQTAMETVEPLGKPLYATVALWNFWPGAAAVRAALPDIDQSIGAFNVSTYFLQPYADLGTAGTLLCTALIAAASGTAFALCRGKRSVAAIAALSLMDTVIFLMHNNLFLRSTSVLIWLILAAGVHLVARRETQYRGKEILSEKHII